MGKRASPNAPGFIQIELAFTNIQLTRPFPCAKLQRCWVEGECFRSVGHWMADALIWKVIESALMGTT